MPIARWVRVLPHEGGAFLMNLESDRCFGVNQTGATVVDCLRRGVSSPMTIAQTLVADAAEDGISVGLEQVLGEVEALLKQLTAAGIVE